MPLFYLYTQHAYLLYNRKNKIFCPFPSPEPLFSPLRGMSPCDMEDAWAGSGSHSGGLRPGAAAPGNLIDSARPPSWGRAQRLCFTSLPGDAGPLCLSQELPLLIYAPALAAQPTSHPGPKAVSLLDRLGCHNCTTFARARVGNRYVPGQLCSGVNRM